MKKLCIGLFGTCGSSKWRDNFVKSYNEKNINYYNPNVPDWKPENAIIEAEHLTTDSILLFPITSETYGTGSLAEVGFSVLQAVTEPEKCNVIFLIDKNLDENLKENPALHKESTRARTLVREHLKKNLTFSNVHLVESLEDMLNLSIKLYERNLNAP
jgi:hypothetical protein